MGELFAEQPSCPVTAAPNIVASALDLPAAGIVDQDRVLDTVTVLCARADSIYKTMSGCDVYDAARNAWTWPSGRSVVAHPPCGQWGQLAHMAKQDPIEKALAGWCVDMVRAYGGVLEHPAKSKLWPVAGLPEPSERDAWGGWTLPVLQWWWGHKAEKATRLYIVGCEPSDIPTIPFRVGYATHVINTGHGVRKGHHSFRPHCTHREREATPPQMAQWLVEVARLCRHHSKNSLI